ncbi:hypothetical protein SU69_05535 [Thermosipho melanesiensis]|uniref:ATPase involved in DNA repair-like protein n=2 Tax=Thermosipho melanesiensis TaxID=46541 RepID=A6LLZ4_THEM4|nr:AAA family ATPase [Thermosipho melanesiensis]ABR30945.1 ATPase involved in DNA repair-like protein [Thermosipho melanesiensis BI429]APT74874.1 hypothetical protein BW47_05800 [Thermosipho melanesiensis]OOC35988.1 hypothetical protein SU68_05595 [Thermosipho melanesiensis]OOC38127.1 hypothetical protein SU69_05535 [Thermosipho melanesiensis]OOC38256.1 hypothetical protein SU70_05545 [Thermosipho melanesiensis]
MKIKTVKINGIRGFQYHEAPHVISLDCNHFFLFGENGTGKFSFFDALEWGLTGDVNETRVRKVGSKQEYLRNKFCLPGDEPYVEVKYKNNSKEATCKRILGRQNDCEIIEGIENNFIDSKRIEEFVIDTKQSLWNRFARLLGFDSLIKFEEQLKRLRNKAKNEYESIKEKLNEKRKQIRDIEEEIKNLELRLKKELGENWKSQLVDKDKQGLLETLNKLREKEEALKNFEKTFIEKNNLKTQLNNIESTKEMLKISTNEIQISRVINEALNYFYQKEDINKCPVCGQPIVYKQVLKRLETLKKDLDKIISLDNQKEILNKKLSDLDLKENELKKKLQKYYKDMSIFENSEKSNFIKYEIGPTSIEVRKLEKQIFLLEEKGRYMKSIDDLEKQEEDLKQLKNQHYLKKKIYEDIDKFYTLYLTKYGKTIQEELERISKSEVTNVYNEITQAKNQFIEYIEIKPNIENHEITFKLKIRGKEELVDAITFLSTGHLRCLGFALLIARVKLNSSNVNFIAIDDPIYSVDHERRYFLIKYLRKLANEGYQLIITTSDRTFFDIIRHQFNGNSFNAYKAFLDDYTGLGTQEAILGSVKIKGWPNNYIEKAEEHLENKDLRAAALYSRLALETVFSMAAKKIKLEVPYDEVEKIGIKGFKDAGLKKKLEKVYCDKLKEIDRQFQRLSDNRYFGHLLNSFPLSQEVHFPHDSRISYGYDEIRDLIDILKDFTDFLLNLINGNKRSRTNC